MLPMLSEVGGGLSGGSADGDLVVDFGDADYSSIGASYKSEIVSGDSSGLNYFLLFAAGIACFYCFKGGR